MYRPSRDQSEANFSSSDFRRRLLLSLALDGLLEEVVADGVDHAAGRRGTTAEQNAPSAPNVNRELTPRFRSRIQMSVFPLRGSPRSNASRSPPGENAGLWLSPGSPTASPSLPERSTQRNRSPDLSGPVGERPVARDREAREADAVRADVLGQRDRLAGRLQGLRVERLGDERLVAHEEEVPRRRVRDERLRRREGLRLGRVERADPVRVVLRLLAGRHVEKVPAVRKELGPADLRLLARRLRAWRRRRAFPRQPRRGRSDRCPCRRRG